MKSFKHHFQVPFHELDPGGILFFSHLFSHAHDAYAGLLAETGCSLKSFLDAGGYLIPLVHAEADYRQPLQLDDQVFITVVPAAPGNSSLSFSYSFHKDGICCANAKTTHVFLHKDNRQPAPVPDKLRKALKPYIF